MVFQSAIAFFASSRITFALPGLDTARPARGGRRVSCSRGLL